LRPSTTDEFERYYTKNLGSAALRRKLPQIVVEMPVPEDYAPMPARRTPRENSPTVREVERGTFNNVKLKV